MLNRMFLVTLCGLLVFVASARGQDKRQAKYAGLHVESLMTAAEFKKCGLNKLSPEEIAHLDSWLSSFGNRVAGATSTNAKETGTPDVIESEIDGEFHGWSGETIFKLTNGQIWQQAEYDYDYEYDYHPEVVIFKTAGGYKMRVKGVEDTIYVKRIK
jgi:hypothetical protein